MEAYIRFADRVSAWFGKAFAWSILVMTFGVGYEVFVRYVLGAPTSWAFDISYMMYGALFMMGGAYTLSRDGHVRGDVVYRLWRPRTQAIVELVLYFLFFFPGILALIFAGWKYASRSLRYMEVSVMSPANVPIFQFKLIIVAAGILLFQQGIAQVFRCILCIRRGAWPQHESDVEELEEQLIKEHERDILHHGGEAIDIVLPAGQTRKTFHRDDPGHRDPHDDDGPPDRSRHSPGTKGER
ncbi:TRAP transporter small permease subunit [Afifella sp. H1R]|uniref:TRAP transporter small permease subunit n=1 Tax=Afifella sp. H1R TaxID=2908841 RepID=UPI001F3D1920|nr:TRAP transporter small permease subunit [Afifella sp. H1R]MCF1503659.1 TRAP transporter small permease subunit [Afifella sp. H1R]